MKQSLFLLISAFFISLNIQAQYVNIEIDNSGGTGYVPNEPFISFNPENLDQMVIGTNISYSYYSNDKGYSWTKVPLTSESYGVWGDPCVINDNNGDFYFFHLSNPTSGGSWIDRIVCQKSENNGLSWNDISSVGLNGDKQHDKETAVVDRASNNIYLTWTQMDAYHSSEPSDVSTIMFSSSFDMAQTWTTPYRLSQHLGDSNGGSEMLRSAIPCVGPEGQVYVSWAGKNAEGDLGIIFDKSTNQGETWLDEDVFVCDFPGGSHFDIPGIYPGMGAGWSNTVCDTSGGAYNGNIYINWADQRNGTDNTDIWMVKSENQGETWSSPIKVNNDDSDKHQFFTWMAVDQVTGNLFFVFYDRRNHSDNETDVFMAVSEDGGETFSNVKISTSSFLPTEDVFFGDYSNIIAHNNVVRPVWTRLDGGTISVMTAIADHSQDVEYVNPNHFSETQLYPNPSKYETHFSFKLKHKSKVTLKVLDIYGKEVCKLINDDVLQAGKYVKTFNAYNYSLASGIYYFSLFSDEQNITKKFLLK